MKRKTIGDVELKNLSVRFAQALSDTYDRQVLKIINGGFIFQPKYVKRWVKEPRFTIPVKAPYIGRSYDHEMGDYIENEWIFGFKTIYTIKLGSKRILREVPVIRKFKQKTVKFKRWAPLKAETK